MTFKGVIAEVDATLLFLHVWDRERAKREGHELGVTRCGVYAPLRDRSMAVSFFTGEDRQAGMVMCPECRRREKVP